MDVGSRPLTPLIILLGFIAGLITAHFWISRHSGAGFRAVAEYRVFLPGTEMPTQDRVLDHLVRVAKIGPAEGLVMSDVRLYIGLVRREGNLPIFRPDLYVDAEGFDAEALAAIAGAGSFVRLRYLSEEPLPDRRHLRFLVRAAQAYAKLSGGSLIYDATAERIFVPTRLDADPREPDEPNLHVSLRWVPGPEGGRLESHGFAKIGMRDIQTGDMAADEELLVRRVLDEAVAKLWNQPADAVGVEAFDDLFEVTLEPGRTSPTRVHILRIDES